jgi:dipeptidyl aminopeptidase/acylaminoacyl peptidase
MSMASNRRTLRLGGTIGFLASLAFATEAWTQEVDYSRAEQMLHWNVEPLVTGDAVNPQWLADGNRFWYRNKTSTGHQFVLVDPIRNTRGPLFDHYRMAAAMGLAADTSFIPDKLPFDSFRFVRDETAIEVIANRKKFQCDLRAYTCTVTRVEEGETNPPAGGGGPRGAGGGGRFVESPDGQQEAFVIDHNLYVRPTGGGDTTQLTTDGEEYWAYGFNEPRPFQLMQGGRALTNRRPNLVWSPDSRRIVVQRRDERNVEHMHYISFTPQRPRHFSQPYALPGDSVIPYPGFHVLTLDTDIATDGQGGQDGPSADGQLTPMVRVVSNVAPRVEPTPHQLSFGNSAVDSTWALTSDKLYVTYFTRGSKSVHLAEIDANTGEHRVIVSDSSKTFVETSQRNPSSWWVSDNTDDVLWWSERDGWAHIYRYDKWGNLKNQVTSGPWAVGYITRVDEDNQQIFFTAQGREPGHHIYYPHHYRVNFDGSGLTLVSPERGFHKISWSPSGRFFVDQYSRIDIAPVTVLRDAAGRIIRTLEEADISQLTAMGWKPPTLFSVKARDGVTDLYGLMFTPADLDSTKKYPVVEHIYPGPQVGSVRNWAFDAGRRHDPQSLAELGFIVVAVDHLGTPWRSKSFHDHYYGNFIDNGIPDHVTAVKQLAARYPFMDIDRVGIFGKSGGGFASTAAIFRFPDFYKVAVSGAGNHNNASYNIGWAEKYQGLMERDTLRGTDNFEAHANKTYAANLEGKLLLVHGDMDDNVHHANTIQVVDALIKANRDFDLIVAPDFGHGIDVEPYLLRRRWDYFVRHLMGVEPPKEYVIRPPEN